MSKKLEGKVALVTGAAVQFDLYGDKGCGGHHHSLLASELGPGGIRVNSINPDLVMTEGIKTIGMHEGEFYEKIKADTPLGRVGTPDDFGAVAVFLASDDSHWVMGEALKVFVGNR